MTPDSENPHILSHRARLAAQAHSPIVGVDAALASMLAEVGPIHMFQVMVQLLPHAALFVVDAQRNVVCWNDGARRMLGFTAEQVLGRYCLTANRCYQCMLGCGLSEHGAIDDVPLVLLHEDGRQVHVRKTARAFFDAQHRFIGGIELLILDVPPISAASIPAAHDFDHAQAQNADHEAAHRASISASAAAHSVATASMASTAAPAPILRKLPSPRTLSEDELRLKVREALDRSNGHIGRAAELLGVSRPTLWRWRKRLNLGD